MEAKVIDFGPLEQSLANWKKGLAMLREFEYSGNVRALRNPILELTSYLEEDEPISIQLVQFAVAKPNYRIGS